MIHLQKLADKDIYTFSVEDPITPEDLKNVYAFFEEAEQKKESVKLLAVINQIPSLSNLTMANLKEGIQMKLKAIRQTKKYALVSDKKWINKVASFADFILPNIPIQSFSFDDYDEAVRWLEVEEVKEIAPEDYFSKMDVSNIKGTNIYTYTVDGKMDKAGLTALHEIFKEKASKAEKIKLLADIKSFGGFKGFDALVQGIKLDVAVIGKVEKYAIVTDKDWVENFAKIGNFLLPNLPIKVYEEDEKEEALTWLKAN